MSESLKIPYSKGHLLYSLFILGIFFYFPVTDIYKNGYTLDSPTTFMLPIATVLFIYFMVKVGMPSLSGATALALTPEGIVDNVRSRTIYWEDIERFDIGTTNTTSVVAVFLKDYSKYKPSGVRGRISWWLGKFSFGSPVIIGTKELAVKDASALIQIISDYWDKVFIPENKINQVSD